MKQRQAIVVCAVAACASLLGACSILFSEGGGSTLAAGDGGVSVGDAGTAVIEFSCPDGGVSPCTVLGDQVDDRSFSWPEAGLDSHVMNVALVVSAADVFGAAQLRGNTASATRTVWGHWSRSEKPRDVNIGSTLVCENSADCFGFLHLSAAAKVSFVYSPSGVSTCRGGAFVTTVSPQSNPNFLPSCFGKEKGVQDSYTLHAVDRPVVYLAGTVVNYAMKNEPASAPSELSGVVAASGLWGGALQTNVFGDIDALFSTDTTLRAVTRQREPDMVKNEAFGAPLSLLTAARTGDTVYLAGLDTEKKSFVLSARNWPTAKELPKLFPSIEELKLGKPFAGSKGVEPWRKPLLMQIDAAGKLWLVARSLVPGSEMQCNLVSLRQQSVSPQRWTIYTLAANTPCEGLSFDASLDGNSKLHIIYGMGVSGASVGYKVISP